MHFDQQNQHFHASAFMLEIFFWKAIAPDGFKTSDHHMP
jgi:hypothetical protein